MKQTIQKLKTFLKKENNIIDLILFGSIVKGKSKYNDIDIALISNETINRIEIKKRLEQLLIKKIDLQIITLKDYTSSLWITLIREGFSINQDKFLHEIYHLKPITLYKYSLKELSLSQKVMFERAIKNIKDIERLSNRVILVPIKQTEEFNSFLRHWNIDFDSEEYGLLPLLRKETE